MTVTEARRLSTNSATINKEDVRKLGKIIEKIPNIKSIEYAFISHERKISSKSLEAFLEVSWPDNILTLEIEGKGEVCEILISVETYTRDANEESMIQIQGNDPVIVNGILSQVTDLFQTKKNYHFVAYTKLCTLLQIIIYFLISYGLWPFMKTQLLSIFQSSLAWFLYMIMLIYLFLRRHFENFIKWLFPYTYIELPRYSLRKRVKWFFIIIIMPFVINFIYDVITYNIKLYPL